MSVDNSKLRFTFECPGRPNLDKFDASSIKFQIMSVRTDFLVRFLHDCLKYCFLHLHVQTFYLNLWLKKAVFISKKL